MVRAHTEPTIKEEAFQVPTSNPQPSTGAQSEAEFDKAAPGGVWRRREMCRKLPALPDTN